MASRVPLTPDGEGVAVVYDGECPFCSAYVTMLRLREAFGTVALVNARSDDPLAREARARFDLDEGMAARIAGRWYHGADCMHVLALASGRSGLLNRLTGAVFASPRRAAALYPVLRTGRNAALWLLRRRGIGDGRAPGVKSHGRGHGR